MSRNPEERPTVKEILSCERALVEELTDEQKIALRHLLIEHKYLSKSGSGIALSPLEAVEAELEKIVDLARKEGFFKVLICKKDVLGAVVAEKSAFDTEHFGFGIGKLKRIIVSNDLPTSHAVLSRDLLLRECPSWMKKANVECMISRVSYDDVFDIAAHERNDFWLADVLLTFHLNTDSAKVRSHPRLSDIIVCPVRSDDEAVLMDIARCSLRNDHFHRDPRFPKRKCDELFSRWVYNCCHGLADKVLVATLKDEPVGFIACKIAETENVKHGTIDLIAVSPSYRHKGIGEALVEESVRVFVESGAKSVSVGTQANNIGAVRTYEKIGFRLARTDLTFHNWLE